MADPDPYALALTGEPIELDCPLESTLDRLREAGWPPERIAAVRDERRAAKASWPFPAPAELVRPVGFARFRAGLDQLVQALGLEPGESACPAQRPPDQDDRRLLAERPPHWG